VKIVVFFSVAIGTPRRTPRWRRGASTFASRDVRASGPVAWNESLPSSGITNYLLNGETLEDVQYLAGHTEPRTTGLYDRRQKQVTRNIVERISV